MVSSLLYILHLITSSHVPYVCAVMSDSLQPHGLRPAKLLCLWGFSRPEYWSGLPCPPPGIFPIQGSYPSLLHCRWILYHLSHQVSSRNTGMGSLSLLTDLGIKTGSPALQMDFIPAELPEKSLSLAW